MKRRINTIKTDLEGYKNNLDLYRLLNLDESVISDTYKEIGKVLEIIDEVTKIESIDSVTRIHLNNKGYYDIVNSHIQDIVLSSADTEYDEVYRILDIDKVRNDIVETETNIEKLYFLAKDAKYLAFDNSKQSVVFICSDNSSEQREVVNRTVYYMCSKLKTDSNVLSLVDKGDFI